METRQLEQVKELINRIADYYDLPDDEEVEEMRRLTGVAWDAEDLQMLCCEYWSHHSLEETAFMMLHEHYPPVHEVDLVFWRCKPGAVLDDQAVYEKYRLGKGSLKALEALPLEEILQKIREECFGWEEDTEVGQAGRSWRFDCLEQADDWTDTHFWLFAYGRETEIQREHQMLQFSCHNMSEEQIQVLLRCMEHVSCPLHIRTEKDIVDED